MTEGPRIAEPGAGGASGTAAVRPARVIDATPRFRDPTLVLLELEAEIREQKTERELVFHLLNETRRLLPARQAFCLERRHPGAPLQVRGVSSLATVDRNVPLIRWIERTVQQRDAAGVLGGLHAFDRTEFAEPDEQDAATYPFGHALWLPLRETEGGVGSGVLFFASEPWTDGHRKIAERLGATYAHAWNALAGPQRAWRRWHLDRRARWVAAAAVLLACVFPVSMSALAPVEISAADPSIVAAPLTGVVADILVAPNSTVKAGQPILRFEDTRLRNELELAQRKVQVASARFASTAQAAIDSSDANREVAINKAELDLATAQYDYARELMAKSVLTAPVDGIAIYTDRRDWQGRPVETGQQIMKIADPARTEFSIFLPVQDSLLIEEGAKVSVYLDSDPLRPITARLERAGYQAEKTENGAFAFRLIARAESMPAGIRIGTRGTAQVYGGKVPLAFYVLRRPITALRQAVGVWSMLAQALADDASLPELREELRIERGSPLVDGAPSWTIFDPLRHAYFQIGQAELALLAAWRGGPVRELRRRFTEQQGTEADPSAIGALLHFLTANSLTRLAPGQAVASLETRARAQRHQWWEWLLHHYLFIRIPLVKPHRFLRRTLPWVRPLFSGAFLALVATLGLVGLYFVSRQWDEFIHTFPYFFSFDGLVVYGLSLAFTKTLHELGHAYAATRYGCRVPTMGVSFLVMVPVLYTDTTDTWKLRSRRQRLLVDGAGVLTELCLASVATFLWAFLPDGAFRSAAFVIATTSWITTLAINLSPFMRFDGYYFMSDMVGVPNLSARSTEFGRWKLREWLFGLGQPMPEPVSARMSAFFVAFAWASWAYRFFLFLGIALVVYHFFFKAVGLVLFAVEIAWFIALPVWREFKAWWQMREAVRRAPRSPRTLLVLLALVVLGFLPLDTRVGVPAVLGARQEEPIFAPEAAQVVSMQVAPGARVAAGQVLFTLRSPAVEEDEKESRIRLALLQARLARSVADKIDRAMTQELLRGIQAEQQAVAGLQKRRRLLEVKAPFAGRVADLDPDLHAGEWITGKQLLARVVGEAAGLDLRGYVEGQHAWRIAPGALGRFVPDDPQRASFKVRLQALADVASDEIESPYLVSTHGGPIAVNVTDKGAAVPTRAQHKVLLQPDADTPASRLGDAQVIRGMVSLQAEGESFFAKASRQVLRVLARESGL